MREMFARREFLKILGVGALGAAVAGLIGYAASPHRTVKEVAEKPGKPTVPTSQIVEITPRVFKLPEPVTIGTVSVEEAIQRRRSRREYLDKPLEGFQLSQLLWASQGVTEPRSGFRAAPSAGATYPLEVYAVVGEHCVKDMASGIYRYNPKDHTMASVATGDFRSELSSAALGQTWVAKAPLNVAVAAVYDRTTRFYGSRGVRYVDMEVGHVGQNVYLIAVAMGLGAVVVGAFHDDQVKRVLRLPKEQVPLYIIPVGRP